MGATGKAKQEAASERGLIHLLTLQGVGLGVKSRGSNPTWTLSCSGDVRSLGAGDGSYGVVVGKDNGSKGASGSETLGFYSEMRGLQIEEGGSLKTSLESPWWQSTEG